MIPWLDPNQPPSFPETSSALNEPNGLLAAGGALSVEWLLEAYRQGIFPWFSDDEPILWWTPAPR
ncbi:MAG: leucyl/phenylalanyl-tRNA--protein transferase, partial [Rubritalea sp.]